MAFTRYLKYQFPLLVGEDVLQVQRQLLASGYRLVGTPDGKFGSSSDEAVRAFQREHGMTVDGIVGPATWNAIFAQTGSPATDRLRGVLPQLSQYHAYRESIRWRVQRDGLEVEKKGFERTGGDPKTVRRVWDQFGYAIDRWSSEFGVPTELIVATICTETSGDPTSVRLEPGYQSDAATPNKVSPGLMQTLISTAQITLQDPTINRAWLLEPGNSIHAGTAYIAGQWKTTNFDPPKVACAYNAGSIYYNDNAKNRWKMRQYPIGSSEHADRFVQWYNDFYFLMAQENVQPKVTFRTLLTA